MFGIGRRSAVVVPAVAALVLFASPRSSLAEDRAGGPLEKARGQVDPKTTLFGFEEGRTSTETAPTVEVVQETPKALPSFGWLSSWASVWAADYHPETDRWTERNNRIKISVVGAGYFPAQNLRLVDDAMAGIRVSWEVPGFIGVRLENLIDPVARLEVREGPGGVPGQTGNHNKRHIEGIVNLSSLSVAIFNPELSVPANLAMWAGFGVDLWYYNFADRSIRRNGPLFTLPQNGEQFTYYDWNVGGNAFFDIQYKITDIFHVGMGIRDHVLYAPQTERGEFYKINGHTQGKPHNRNQDFVVALSNVAEVNLTLSVLF